MSTPQLTISHSAVRLAGHALLITSALLVAACGGRTNVSRQDAASSRGGEPASGGSPGTGGRAQGTGGASPAGSGGFATGGVTATGGGAAFGGTTTTGGTTATGGTSATGGTTATGGTAASPLARFCQGESKVGRLDSVVEPPVTAYRLDMAACCAARYGILLHSHALMGSDYEITVMQTAPDVSSEVYPVGDAWEPLRVLVKATDDTSDVGQVASGKVSIIGNPDDPEGFRIGLCVETPAGDAGQPPLVFHIPESFIAPEASRNRFAIYLLEDPKQPSSVVASTPLESLVLEEHPLLDLGNIASITQASAEVRTSGTLDIGRAVANLMGSLLLMPFVVEADGERIYLGNFVSPISSNLGDGPIVHVGRMGAARFRIEIPFQHPDPRWDQRILKVLGETNRLLP